MAEIPEAEMLAREPRIWRPGRTGAVAIALVALIVVVGIALDRKAYAEEASALDRCAERVAASTVAAMGPVTMMANYVRVARDRSDSSLSRDLDASVSRQAAGAEKTLEVARAECRRVSIRLHHRSFADRKARCLDQLKTTTEYLVAIARDGGTMFRDSRLRADPSC
jgi:hypothetical protein